MTIMYVMIVMNAKAECIFVTDGEGKIGESILAPGMRKRPAGTLQALHKGRGLACLNLQAALQAAQGQQQLELGEGGPTVTPWRPVWWPKDWGEEQPAS